MAVPVTRIFIYPDPEGPGQEAEALDMELDGLEGDEPTEPPVFLTSSVEYVVTHPRSNIVADMPTEALDALIGQQITVGADVVLRVVGWSEQYAGAVGAFVVAPGTVRVGDLLALVPMPGPAAPDVQPA